MIRLIASPWALPAALAASVMGVSIWLAAAPAPGGPVAAIYPPWWSTAAILQAAAPAGAVIRFGAAPFIVVVMPVPGGGTDMLKHSGAWAVINPASLGACSRATIEGFP